MGNEEKNGRASCSFVSFLAENVFVSFVLCVCFFSCFFLHSSDKLVQEHNNPTYEKWTQNGKCVFFLFLPKFQVNNKPKNRKKRRTKRERERERGQKNQQKKSGLEDQKNNRKSE